jgi:superfamily II DNA or RNA helicase
MTTSLSCRGYGISKEYLSTKELNELRDNLTVEPYNMMTTANSPSNCFPLYMESTKRIYIPKAYGLKTYGVPEEDKQDRGDDISLTFIGALRPEQQAPVETFLKAARNPEKCGGIISLPCGFGKTVCALYIISKLKKKTLIVVHKEFLLDQWKERIEYHLPDARVGIIKAQKCVVEGMDIVIGSLQSLTMKQYDGDVLKGFGMMVVDEVHHTGAQVFSKVYRKLNTRMTLGLSATVRRKDGLTKVFKWYIGDIVYKVNKRNDTMKVIMREYYSPSHEYSRPYFMVNKKPNMSKMINNICDYQPRNQFIIKCLLDALEKEPQRKVLILSDRRTHLETLKRMLEDNGIDSGLCYGGLKQDIIKQSEEKQVMLGTYAYVSEGFDVKTLNMMVLASPKSDVVQSTGRILREAIDERKYQPLVIDIVDAFSVFPNQAKKRLSYYRQQNYDIIQDKLINDADIVLNGTCYIQDDKDIKI